MRRFRNLSGALALGLCVLTMFVCAPRAHAAVAVLVEEPYGDFARVNRAGHSAVYLDHVCAESPTKLRACREGELGAVISRYRNVGGYDWLAMPLVAYLYAVDSVDDIPITMDAAAEARLREAYRRKYLLEVAQDKADGTAPDSNWYQLVGAAYDRTLYGFQVKTTADQDAGFIAIFNDRKNFERYNGAFRNCADFARVTINRFYPHAVKRNLFADVGITTPKHVGQAVAKFGDRHPEVEFAEFVVPQVPGSLPRSRSVKGVAECLLSCPRYAFPLTAVAPVASAALGIAYLKNGRFAMPKDAPVLAVRPVDTEITPGGSLAREEALPMPASVVKTSFTAASAAVLSSE